VLAAQQMPTTLQETWDFYRLATLRSQVDHASLIPESIRLAPSEPRPVPQLAKPATAGGLSLWDSSDEEFRAELKRHLDRLDALRDDLGTGPTKDDFERLSSILGQVLTRPPDGRTFQEFFGHLIALIRRANQNYTTARAQFESLQQQARLG
jgi:hypothetical protein